MQKSILEYRCVNCNKLLAKGSWDLAKMEIKCLRCGEVNSFFDSEVDQIIITDDKGIVRYANQSLVNLTGYSLTEVIGKTPGLWGGQMPQKFYQDLWHKIKDNKKIAIVEVLNKTKKGKMYKAILRISPILDVNGKPMMFLGIETKILPKSKVMLVKKD